MDATGTVVSKLGRRRSQRIPLAVPVVVTSLDPKVPYLESCVTITINAHGCGISASRPLKPGTPVRLEIHRGKHSTMAHVAVCAPLEAQKSWGLGIQLDKPENFWGVQFPPEDWDTLTAPPAPEVAGGRVVSPVSAAVPASPSVPEVSPAPEAGRVAAEEAIARFQLTLREKAKSISAEFEKSAKAWLDARLAEAMARFVEETNKIMSNSIAERQAALDQTLESISSVLREALGRVGKIQGAPRKDSRS